MKKDQLTVYLDPSLTAALDDIASRRRVPKSKIVESALATFLSPDGPDQAEAAITRRLDRLTRAIERLDRNHDITGEALALFIRFWLTATPPVPDDLREAANAKGKGRYASFVETLGRRLAKGTTLAREVTMERVPEKD